MYGNVCMRVWKQTGYRRCTPATLLPYHQCERGEGDRAVAGALSVINRYVRLLCLPAALLGMMVASATVMAQQAQPAANVATTAFAVPEGDPIAGLLRSKSMQQQAQQHAVEELSSQVAYVIDQDGGMVLLEKNAHHVLPIASITKLMTGLVISENRLAMDEVIAITEDDIDRLKGSRSRLKVGTLLTRGQLLLLSLMSSENRAAHALARTFPGGEYNFVRYMNQRAQSLGMRDTRFVESTGLSSANRSSARDLALLVQAAAADPLISTYTTVPDYELPLFEGELQYRNTNVLTRHPEWEIGLQKTGYIREAGRCLVMQTLVSGRRLVMVFLNAGSTRQRTEDAKTVKSWLEVPSLAHYNR